MSETSPEGELDEKRLESVAETIREGHEAADQLADQNVIDPDSVSKTEGDGEDVAPDDPA